MNTLHIITVISNPVRYKSRYKLYREFAKHVACSGGTLWTAEMAFGDRPFEITEPNNPFHLQLRSHEELWHKENLMNLMMARLPLDWEYVAFVDADVLFQRPDWVEETVHQLQHYMVVQMFSHVVDLSPTYQIIKQHNGYVWSYFQNGFKAPEGDQYKKYGIYHPGFAWAWRREALEQVGGLIDIAILGAADRHMANGLIGTVLQNLPPGLSDGYKEQLLIWQERAVALQRDVGYVEGTISHHWHGKKKNRFYQERWSILIDNKYDPEYDLKKDWSGLWQLSGNKPMLRDQIRNYFRVRNEDSIDL